MEGQENINLELILITGTAGMFLLAGAVVTFIYLYQRKLIKKKIAFQQIEQMLHKQELKSAYALLEGQDMERQRIAEEMHDSLGGSLVTLTMYADTFLKSTADSEQNALAEKVRIMAQKAYEEARKLSHRLDTGMLKHFGLKAAINDLVKTVAESGHVKINLALDLSQPLSSEVSLNIYRVIQELINNTLKHAQASEINLNLSQVNDEYISLIYEDDGKGIPLQLIESKGMGIRNIRSRIEKLNGNCSFDRTEKRGFTMIAEIPV
ncbi:MAG TPA: histidine kinase [Cyclobacteriaceae bacterium]|nr:histidine kinase [Cyclobacteriaceae bacterium]